MLILVGLFGKTPKFTDSKDSVKKYKEFKKLLKDKKYPEALKSGLSLLESVPHHHDALFMVGSIYYLKENYKTALSYLNRSLEIGEYDIDALLLKAYSHQKLSEKKYAISCCDKIKEIDPKNKSVLQLLEQLEI